MKLKAQNFKLALKPLFWVCAVISRFFKPKYWIVKKCGFPHNEGYGTYNWKTHTVLDTGLTKEDANAICRELNGL